MESPPFAFAFEAKLSRAPAFQVDEVSTAGEPPRNASAVRYGFVMPYRQPPPRRTKVLRFCLDVLAKPSPCPESWDLMDGGECQRSCHRCGETVIDVGAMEPTEAEALLEERITEAPFLDLWVREDGRVMTKPCSVGMQRQRRVRLGAIVVGLAALALAMAAR